MKYRYRLLFPNIFGCGISTLLLPFLQVKNFTIFLYSKFCICPTGFKFLRIGYENYSFWWFVRVIKPFFLIHKSSLIKKNQPVANIGKFF